ncbi:MAG TPA: helix-turn-helix transcriptional regulator [Candidatus Dormibacteraeota bacterium]|nr:helix-turn-helix transcriptional regulator [Candidatus Dormibacteraeota bacterium]
MSLGAVLAERRGERGLTIEQVASATRIRAEYLRALEADQPGRLPAPVYAKGYLRTYARYLGLDPEPLVEVLRSPAQNPRRALGLGMLAVRPRVVLTAPAAAAVGLMLFAGAFAIYAWRQVEADQRPGITLPSGQQAAAAPATPVPSPSPEPRPIVVGVHVTDAVWLNVIVDGKPQYSDAGKVLPAGSQVYFTGLDIKITSGKAAATMITIDGHPVGALGTGVATREFSSQTSP